MQKELQVGVLTKPHGVHGAVKVFPTTDDTRRFKKGQEFILERKKERRTVKVEKVQTSGQFVVLKFEGFETPEEIAPYASCPLLVDREHAVALKKDEFFLTDLEGLSVYRDTDGALIGTVTSVMPTGANEVLIIKAVGGEYDGIEVAPGKELLFPSIKECIKQIDVPGGKIVAHLMTGLIEPEG